MMPDIHHIAIVGSGNVANYMGHLLKGNGFIINKIISRNELSGRTLAGKLNSSFSAEPVLTDAVDLVLLCVNDDEIARVSQSFPTGDFAVCHCAGSIPMQVLNRHAHHGVLYPLQSIHRDMDMASVEVPFLIEANTGELLESIQQVLNSCRKASHIVDSEQRLYYHLAAVFANNFTNAMMMAAEDILNGFNLDFNRLKPLMKQTFQRIDTLSPQQVQTGPAKRHDMVTMQKHLELLSTQKDMQILYQSVSAYIGSKFKK